jgi:hypothetical protein
LVGAADKSEEVYITDAYRRKIEEATKFEMVDKIKEEWNKSNMTSKDVKLSNIIIRKGSRVSTGRCTSRTCSRMSEGKTV